MSARIAQQFDDDARDREREPDVYDVCGDEPVPSPTALVPAQTPAPLAYRRNPPLRYDLLESQPLKHLYIPIVLVSLGSAAMVFALMWRGRTDFLRVVRFVGYVELWNILAVLFGAWIVAKLLVGGFGALPTVTIRLAAIAIVPLSLTMTVAVLTQDSVATLCIWLLSVAACFAMFLWFFELDPQEAFISLGVTTVVRWLSYVLYWMVLRDYLPSPF